MSIRQIRLNSIEIIKDKIAAYKGQKINLVLANSTSVYGELVAVESVGVVIKNQRLKEVHLSWNNIVELYFDQTV